MELQNVTVGSTDYIERINGNNAVIVSNINSLLGLQTSQLTNGVSFYLLLGALFGNTVAVRVGLASYAITPSGSTIAVTAGAVWKPSLQQLVASSSPVTLDFSGQQAGTHYIVADAGGIPMIVDSSADSMYSVVWTGSGFGTITENSSVLLSAADQAGALKSTRYGQFSTLNARLTHIESLLP
jgi:Fe2+ transport system protein FeoA